MGHAVQGRRSRSDREVLQPSVGRDLSLKITSGKCMILATSRQAGSRGDFYV